MQPDARVRPIADRPERVEWDRFAVREPRGRAGTREIGIDARTHHVFRHITIDALWRVTHAPTDISVPEDVAACGPVHSSGWLCPTPRRQPGRTERTGQPARTPTASFADDDQRSPCAERTANNAGAPTAGALVGGALAFARRAGLPCGA